MAGLQSGEGRMIIDSVVWAQYINVTDTRTDSHMAIANAAPTHCVARQKTGLINDILFGLYGPLTGKRIHYPLHVGPCSASFVLKPQQ